MKLLATKCSCGAITIADEENTFQISMRPSTFRKEYRGKG